MLKPALKPPPIMESVSGVILPEIRPADLPGIVSIAVTDLFSDIPKGVYASRADLSVIRKKTRESLSGVDMGKIKPESTVNILCSEHGFVLMGGAPYAEVVRTIHDVVKEKTGCRKIRLRLCAALNKSESREIEAHFHLKETFGDRIVHTGPFDPGIPIETEIGTLYGLKRVYDADFFIHCHYDDPREVYLHRLITRTLKSFAMSYARFETRSAFHMQFGARSSNILSRALFESPFVQKKHAFTSVLEMSPAGVIGVDSDTDAIRLNRRLTINTLKHYGKMLRLFAEIDACVVVLDAGRWPWYLHAGGVASCNLYKGPADYLDLTVGPKERGTLTMNPAVKAIVVNHVWGAMLELLAIVYPIYVANPAVAAGLPRMVTQIARIGDNLHETIAAACDDAGTDKILVFDGSYGGVNLSPSLGEFLINMAPDVSRKVETHFLPLWLRQRGLFMEATEGGPL